MIFNPTAVPLTPDMMPSLRSFWEISFPLNPMNDLLLRERIFPPPDAKPENSICHLDPLKRIIAISLLVPPVEKNGERIAGIRWFGVHRDFRRQGFGARLLNETCERMRAMGATEVNFLSTPPYYIQPGVDTRLTKAISWLLRRGFEHVGTNFNMTVDIETLQLPPAEKILSVDPEGYRVRRALREDEPAYREYCMREWTANWTAESIQGLSHEPSSLFIATRPFLESSTGEEIVGFASYETNQCLGCFGPTGVTPAHQGYGLGKRLLYATLHDMKSLGRKKCEIGWVGPVDFYHRAAKATLGPAFWAMRKQL